MVNYLLSKVCSLSPYSAFLDDDSADEYDQDTGSRVPQELLNDPLREYVNVIKIQYPLGENNILPMVWEAITVHEESREAVDLLVQIYSKRRQLEDPLQRVLK